MTLRRDEALTAIAEALTYYANPTAKVFQTEPVLGQDALTMTVRVSDTASASRRTFAVTYDDVTATPVFYVEATRKHGCGELKFTYRRPEALRAMGSLSAPPLPRGISVNLLEEILTRLCVRYDAVLSDCSVRGAI